MTTIPTYAPVQPAPPVQPITELTPAILLLLLDEL